MNVGTLRFSSLFIAGVLLVAPFFAVAQEGDLQTTIRAAISQDPRAGGMSLEQIDSLVSALTKKALEQNVTPQDIVWRPSPVIDATQQEVATNFCPPFPQLFCSLNESFGFDGTDYLIPGWLATTSLLLILLVALRRHHARPEAPPVATPIV